MRIVNKQEFLSLPAGTLYSDYKHQIFDDLKIKHETIFHDKVPIDFVFENIIGNVMCNDSEECFKILLDAEENGSSFNLDFDCPMRDALFEENQLFAIYEREDIVALINKLNGVMNL